MKYQTLAAASLYLNKHKDSVILNKEQKKFLSALHKRSVAIFSTQKGWLKTGLLEQATDVTQEDVHQETYEMQEKSLGFTWVMTNALLTDINRELVKNMHGHYFYKHILLKIQTDISATLGNIRVRFENTDENSELNRTSTWLFFKANDEAREIKRLGGRCILFSQRHDPLRGQKNPGACSGYTIQWAEEINKKGYASMIPRLDAKTLQAQQEQVRKHLLKSSPLGLFNSIRKTEFYKFDTDLRKSIDNILRQMRDDRVYDLAIYFYDSAHATGIRRVAGSLEFFDPNFGTVIFDNEAVFKIWLAAHFTRFFKNDMSKGGEFTLYELGKQGKNAKPSIPHLDDGPPNEDEISEELMSLQTVPAQAAKKNSI